MKKLYILFTFMILITAIYLFLQYEKKNKIQQHLDEKTQQYTQSYNVLYDEYKKLSEVIFKTKINTNEIKNIFKDTLNASQSEKKLIRDKLYNHLSPTYKLLKQYNIKQLHFHLPNNESFLRLHKPLKFGDDLSEVRPTVKYVNENKRPIDGFEEGRIYNGYRFVFPMLYKKQYIGSVEVSFSTLLMNVEIMKNYDVIGKFLISKEIVKKKLFNEELNNYAQSLFEDFFYEKKIENLLTKFNKKNITITVSQKSKEFIRKNGLNSNSFSIFDEDSNTIMSFLKVKSPISNQTVGMLVIRSDASFIETQNKHFVRLISGAVIFLVLLFLFIYRTSNEKERLSESVKRKTKKLIDVHLKMENYIDLIDKNIITSSTDLEGNITYASDAFCQISGHTKDELIGSSHNIIRHPDMPKSVFEEMWNTINANQTWRGEIKNITKDGRYYWVEATISPNFNKNGKKIGYTAIRQNITNKKHIEEISLTDGLTNIFNRRHFNNIFPKVINSAKRHNELVAFIIMDIDHFKQYNDTYGHQMGDDVLIEVAKCIKETLKRADDYCFRLGGEEFAIIFKVDKTSQSEAFANTIRKNIENLKIKHSGNSVSKYITVSIGLVCQGAIDIKDMDDMYKQADDLLYDAKKTGRNKVCF